MSTLSFELPLLRRELLGLLRSRRAFWLLVLSVAVSSLVPLLSWTNAAAGARKGAGNAEIVTIFLITQLAIVLLTVSGTMAGAITAERERGTWESLASTRLSPSSIVLSKLGASLAFVGMLLVASAPAACVLYLQGGVAFGAIFRSYAVTFAAAALAACCSIDESTRAARASQAVAKGLAWSVGWSFIPLFLVLGLPRKVTPKIPYRQAGRFYARRRGGVLAAVLVALFLLSWLGLYIGLYLGPIAVCWLFFAGRRRFLFWGFSPFALIRSEVLDPANAGDWSVYLGVMLAVCLAYCWRAAQQLPLEIPSPPQRDDKPLSPATAARFRAAGRRLARSRLVRRFIPQDGAASTLLSNPVFLRDIDTELHGSVLYQLASFALPLVCFLIIAQVASMKAVDVARSVCAAAAALCLLATSTAAATSFPREVVQGNLDFLRGSALAPREIITGKLLASLHAALGIVAAAVAALAASFVFLLVAVLVGAGKAVDIIQSPISAAYSFALLLLIASYGATAGVLASVVAARALPALLLAYALFAVPLAIFLWPPERAMSPSPQKFFILCAFVAATRALWLLACWWFAKFRMRDR